MKKPNIPWSLVEARLIKLRKDQQWLWKELNVEPNVVTNWKSRGIPTSRATTLAQLLKMSLEELFGGNPVASNQAAGQGVPPNFIDADELSKLIALYMQSTPDGRDIIFNAAVDAEKMIVSRRRPGDN